MTTLLCACGETSKQPGGGGLDKAGNAAGGGLPTSGGSGGSGGRGSGGVQGQSDTCPTPLAVSGSACNEGQSCFYRGSSSPCAPPDATYTCTAGKWSVKQAAQGGVCIPEACPSGTASCPPKAPPQGTACGYCSAQASCQFGAVAAQCVSGLWQVTDSGQAGAGGEAGSAP